MEKNYDDMVSGNSKAIQLIFKDPSTGNRIDITGYKIFMTIKKRIDMEDTDEGVVAKTLDPTDPTNGIADVVISFADTEDLEGKYYYDITYLSPEGDRKTPLIGTMSFIKNVTKRTT